MRTKKRAVRKSKIVKQILIITIELELIVIVSLCVAIHNTSLSHYVKNVSALSMLNVTYASALPAMYMPAKAGYDAYEAYIEEQNRWKGPVLSKRRGTIMGPSGKETYYNLNMSGVVRIMRRMGNTDEYWVRSDGVKMLGDYVMVAANLKLRPRGSLVETSLGTAIVCDTGGFAKRNPTQIDIAVTW
jgi:hypothetical protein